MLLTACGVPAPVHVPMQPEEGRPALEQLLGVTVVPETQQRLWLKQDYGVVDAQGQGVLHDVGFYDDLVSLDAERIAFIRENDGFVFRIADHQLLNRFCYLPGGPALQPDLSQRSYVVGFDRAAQQLYVQPQTFKAGVRTGRALLGVFAVDRADPLEWQVLPDPEMQAGGIAVESRERIWLAWKSTLYLYDANAQRVSKTFSLDVGSDITGLALDGDKLLVLDAEKLWSVPLAAMR
ncbi:MAG: hypothetical protein IPJ65_33750 [Archangiaceae bacterium]|nr:hypothetical protein [Archangiaceae bacterium]